MTKCPKCGNNRSPDNSRYCSICYYPLFHQDETDRQNAVTLQGVPWDNINRLGLWKALLSTIKKCLTVPSSFFSDLAASRRSTMAWLFALIIGSIGAVFNSVWSYFLISPLLDLVPGLDSFTGKNLLSTGQLIFSPLIITGKLLFITGYFHLLLSITHSNRQNIAATFRIACYAQSAAIFDCIPAIGSAISLTWSLYLLSIGFTKVHKISMLRSWMVILLLPVVFSILFGVFAAFLLGTGIIMLDSVKGFLPFIR
jgi:hypothetical protein